MSVVSKPPPGGHMHEVVAETRRLRHRFAPTADGSWDAATAAAELCVQLGHVARCLLRRTSGRYVFDDPERPIVDAGDELADIVLAACSVTVLADTEPAQTAPPESALSTVAADAVTAAFQNLTASAGGLAEAALVAAQYRHIPTGSPPSVAEAASAVLVACDALAAALDLDLIEEFRAMVADADAFLDSRGIVQ